MNYRLLIRHPFIVDNFWYGLSGILLNVLNYAYVLIALHYLSKHDFGAFNALVAILTMAAIITNPLQLHVTRAISHLQQPVLRIYIVAIQGKLLRITLASLLFLVLVSQYFASLLNVSAGHVIIVGIAIAFLISATFATAISSGLRKLTFQAFLGLVSTSVKLLCALVLFEAGLGVTAGLIGYVAGFALTFVITWHAMKSWEALEASCPMPEVRNDSISVLVLSYLFIAVPFSMDQVLAQVLSPAISGDYAALVTVGKLAFYVTVPFQVVLYSYLTGSGNLQQQMNYLKAGLVVAMASSLLLTSLLWAGGRPLTDLLLSPSYASVAEWIVPYSLGICAYVFANAVVSLAIARGDYRILIPICLATIAQISLFLLRYETLEQLVANQLATFGLLSIAALGYLIFCRLGSR